MIGYPFCHVSSCRNEVKMLRVRHFPLELEMLYERLPFSMLVTIISIFGKSINEGNLSKKFAPSRQKTSRYTATGPCSQPVGKFLSPPPPSQLKCPRQSTGSYSHTLNLRRMHNEDISDIVSKDHFTALP